MKLEGGILYKHCGQYQYLLEENQPVLFAIRGCLPEAAFHGNFKFLTEFKPVHLVRPARLNYETARCTIGLWDTCTHQIALFPGSTVPSKSYLFTHASSLETYNILCPGSYELSRGIHPRHPEGFQRHEAFLMDHYALVEIPPVKKLKNTVRFDWPHAQNKVLRAGDNLHAARTEPEDADSPFNWAATLQAKYSSSGCITILGQPAQYVRHPPANAAWNCWHALMDLVNKTYPGKINFTFILLTFSDLRHISPKPADRSIRYGAQGPEVAQMQRILNAIIDLSTGLPYYTGDINGQFLHHTALSYLRFQEDFSKGKTACEIQMPRFLSQTKHFKTL
jgi:hypothetical protein